MIEDFKTARLDHAVGARTGGDAVQTIIRPADFEAAYSEIRQWQGYAPTPLLSLKNLAAHLGVSGILYKDEGPRFGLGSFKALGGAYAALRVLQQELSQQSGTETSAADIRSGALKDRCSAITLVSATDGNHGRSLAWGCQRFGAQCKIYIHAEVSEGRAEAMRAYGADVIRIKGDYDASVALAREEAARNGWFVVSDTSWEGYTTPPRDVMAGYGVMVREICDVMQTPPTHVLLQGGVGGLAAAVAAGLIQRYGPEAPRVIVVEPDRAACLYQSAKAGRATTVKIDEETIMAGLSCGEPSGLAWSVLDAVADDFLTIPDRLVAPTIRMLARADFKDAPVEAGESAVAGLAAVIAACQQADLRTALRLDSNARVLVIGSEGVTDPAIFDAIMKGANHV